MGARRVVVAALALLTLGCAPKTPTFQGTRTERFKQAVAHYHAKMGIQERLYTGESDRFPEYCAWTQRLTGYPGDDGKAIAVAINVKNPHCIARKPEWLALHEVCHVRMKHNDPAYERMSESDKEEEVRKCTYWYEEGVR